ncbi:MAG: hypothetical protein RL662_2495 [Bacteroidota bacterium]|jgi:zinc transport system substrate-binding protein
MKYLLYTIQLVSLVLVLASCNPKASQDQKTLSVSIDPQKYLLEAIAGNKFAINTAIPAGSDPESYDPSPSQMVNIGKSKIYFKVGNMGFEGTWLQNIHVNNPEMKIVDCSFQIPLVHDDKHGGVDPHIWSSPKLVSIISKNMYNALLEYDPKNQEYYMQRYIDLDRSIQKTDSIIRSYLDQSTTKSFVIYHPALSYFANEYGLKQYTIEVDGKHPSPQQLVELIKQAKADSVKVVFLQEEYDKKNAETIANELDAAIVRINPLSYQWDEELIKIAKAIANKYDK